MKKTIVEISDRMLALTKLVSPGLKVWDIGCDHGFVSIYLVQKEIAPKVFAMDVRSGPLSQAQAHIKQYGLEHCIETRLSDGLQKILPGEAECMVCAGMGGPLMIKILEEGKAQALAMKELILQPQSELAEFRKYLRENGYHIIKEDMVFEDGKYYPMMKVVPKEVLDQPMGEDKEKQQIFDEYGQYLLEHKHPVLKQYLEHSKEVMQILIGKLQEQQGERALARLPEVERELLEIREALGYFEGE